MTCSEDGCPDSVHGHGLCQKHYTRVRRHGDPKHSEGLVVKGSLAERLWAKTRRTATCWLWTAATNRKGYGTLSRGDRGGGHILAHRAAWQVTFGPIPEGRWVLHRCDNPPCVRPDHLFLGTPGDNAQDMAAKGRQWKQSVTHCPKGHEYTPENTKPNVGGRGRRCRVCHNQDMRRRRAQAP